MLSLEPTVSHSDSAVERAENAHKQFQLDSSDVNRAKQIMYGIMQVGYCVKDLHNIKKDMNTKSPLYVDLCNVIGNMEKVLFHLGEMAVRHHDDLVYENRQK